MIALIFKDRCDGCNNCVTICPTHVLDLSATTPVIARLDQCQTCYMCELYCTSDAIYVDPDQYGAAPAIDPDAIRASGHLGRIRRDHGWDRPEAAGHLDHYRLLGPLLQEGTETAADRYRVLQSATPST